MKLEQVLVTNGYSKEDLIIVSVPTVDQVSVMISSASLIAESNYEAGRKNSVSDGALRKISTSSIEKKVSFDHSVSIQEEDDTNTQKEKTEQGEANLNEVFEAPTKLNSET